MHYTHRMAKPPTNGAPTVGRIVHYGVTEICAGPDDSDIVVPRAAMVLRVDEPAGEITVQVFHPNGHVDLQKARQSDELVAGAWTWPPRE